MYIQKEVIKTQEFDEYIYYLIDDTNLYKKYRNLELDNNFIYELYISSEDINEFRDRLIEIIEKYYEN